MILEVEPSYFYLLARFSKVKSQMTAGTKLIAAGGIIAALTGYMAYVGTSESWTYYLTVDECLADPLKHAHQRMRVNGKVSAGSLEISDGRKGASFELEGDDGLLAVVCRGPLPDNLAEDMEVVVEGRLAESGLLYGEKVLTRCASKYESQPQSVVARSSDMTEVRR